VEVNCIVPPPIKFNCWKHHAFFIKDEIRSVENEKQIKAFQSPVLKIGESQMDLYCGKLSPGEISNQIIKYLSAGSLVDNSRYSIWLCNNGNEYRKVTLKDKSFWVLRKGDEAVRFVHIHPGRYSPLTLRVKALTLKTAIFTLAFSRIKLASAFDIDLINEARDIYLSASPLKSVSKKTGLGKLLNFFDNLE
jgi:hypothetical protein